MSQHLLFNMRRRGGVPPAVSHGTCLIQQEHLFWMPIKRDNVCACVGGYLCEVHPSEATFEKYFLPEF